MDEQTAELVAAVAAAVDADIGADIVDVDIAAFAEFDEDVDVTQMEKEQVAVDVDDGDVVVEMAGQGVEARALAAAVDDAGAGAEVEDVSGFVAEVEERALVAVGTEAEEQEAVADEPMTLAVVVQTVVVALKVDKNLCDLVETCVEGEEGSVLGGRNPTGTMYNPDALLLALDVDGVGPAHEATVQVEWHAKVGQWANSAAQGDMGPPTAVETQVHMSRTVADIH